MSETTDPAPTPAIQDQIVKQAQSLPQLINIAETVAPDLAASLTPKALLMSKSPPGTLLVTALTWMAAKYGLGWDDATVNLVAGCALLAGAYFFRAITRSPIGGLFSKGTTNA